MVDAAPDLAWDMLGWAPGGTLEWWTVPTIGGGPTPALRSLTDLRPPKTDIRK